MDNLFGTNVISLSAQRTLKKYGQHPITEIIIFRIPLSKILTMALNVASLGTYQSQLKKQPYDSLFHLGLYAKVKGKWIQLDKQQNVNIIPVSKLDRSKGTEHLQISMSQNILLNEFVARTVSKMGKDKFKSYDGKNNNCQIFVNAMLSANGLSTAETTAFVKQDTDWLFKGNNPFLQGIMRRLTDLGASADSAKDKLMNTDMITKTRDTMDEIKNTPLHKEPDKYNGVQDIKPEPMTLAQEEV